MGPHWCFMKPWAAPFAKSRGVWGRKGVLTLHLSPSEQWVCDPLGKPLQRCVRGVFSGWLWVGVGLG